MLMNELPQIPNRADINFEAVEVSRQQSITEQFQLAYHGVAGAIQRKRTERAVNIEEEMDRKYEVYANLGRTMISETTMNYSANKPMSFLERRADRKMDKKRVSNVNALVVAYSAELSFKRNQARNPTTESYKVSQLKAIKKSARQGELTAQEGRMATSKVNARPNDWTSETYNSKFKNADQSSRALVKSAERLEDSQWRKLRRNRSVKRATKAHTKSLEHANSLKVIKSARTDRKILKSYYKAVQNNQVVFGPEEA